MSRVSVQGADAALELVAALPDVSREAGRETVNSVARHLAQVARDKTAEVYNLAPSVLDSFIRVKEASEDGSGAEVTLQVRAIPYENFDPKVEFAPTPVRAFGRAQTTIVPLAQVAIKLFRRGTPRVLKGVFPLKQRKSGQLQPGEKLRRRIGPRRDRLTGLRYVTFPERFLERLLPELQQQAGDDVTLQFSAAWRSAVQKRGSGRRPGRNLKGNA